jgi:superoxide dismutase, Cu-Zn family
MRNTLFLMVVLVPALVMAAPVKATLRDAKGKVVGHATFEPAEGGVTVTVTVTGVSAGLHGFHLHTIGKCEGPAFESAGGHFNPGAKAHGLDSASGAHAGDLPNVMVGSDGKGTGSFLARGVSLDNGPTSLIREGGTSVVLHASADDMKTDPSGNSGARVACGVIDAR